MKAQDHVNNMVTQYNRYLSIGYTPEAAYQAVQVYNLHNSSFVLRRFHKEIGL
jgi:hypothetical protein